MTVMLSARETVVVVVKQIKVVQSLAEDLSFELRSRSDHNFLSLSEFPYLVIHVLSSFLASCLLNFMNLVANFDINTLNNGLYVIILTASVHKRLSTNLAFSDLICPTRLPLNEVYESRSK